MKHALMLLALPASAILPSAALAQVPDYHGMTERELHDLCMGGDGGACYERGSRELVAQAVSGGAPENAGRPPSEQPKAHGRNYVSYMAKACTLEYRPACGVVAGELLQGRYIDYNMQLGLDLFDRECRQFGDRDACRSLASYYSAGVYGVPRDPEKAKFYLSAAPSPDAPAVPRNRPLTPKNKNRWAGEGWESASFREAMEGQSVRVTFTLAVGKDGRPTGCRHNGRTVAEKLFGSEMCAQLMRRARFDPATDSNGNPLTGSYSVTLAWG